MYGDEGFDKAVEYYTRIMIDDDVMQLKTLLKKLPMAPAGPVREYLQRHCRTVRDFEYFFEENSHLFYVENGRVALFDDQRRTRGEAVDYFREILERCEGPVHYMTLKTNHLEHASDPIKNFITGFYPGKEFKNFLRSKPDVFAVHKDRTVFLIEIESVAFYEKRLEAFGRSGLRFIDFRGHVGFASPEVQEYINKYYLGDRFQDFLRRHPDVFLLDREGCVSLAPLS